MDAIGGAKMLTCLDGVSWRAAIVTGWIDRIDVMEGSRDKECFWPRERRPIGDLCVVWFGDLDKGRFQRGEKMGRSRFS